MSDIFLAVPKCGPVDIYNCAYFGARVFMP